ncbi:MAG: tetratricopeptide repeat protein [Verrucomicrobia bacterium]|nr:tetratricopeptide repeat protein [Verrucomicrobiota bacterium]
MNSPGINDPPPGPWISGWGLNPPVPAHASWPAQALRFRAMNSPGSVGPDSLPPGWSFHLEWPKEFESAAVVYYACGFRLSFPRAPEASALVFVPEPGLLCGRLTAGIVPSLFCALAEIQTAGAMMWLSAEHQHVAMVQEAAGTGIRFCLAVEAQAGQAEAVERARRGLEQRFEDQFEAERARRGAFWSKEKNAHLDSRVAHHAVESLYAQLRPPEGLLPFRWATGDTAGPARFNIRHLYPLVLAWAEVEPAMTTDLVKCALSCQQPDGRIPAGAAPGSAEEGSSAALPLIAQAAECAWLAHRESGFPDFVAPRLRRYLRWACRHYDPEQTGPPCWQSAEEALIPETHDAGLASPDLAAFLLCEIEAYLRLARICVATAGDEPAWQAEIQRLKDALDNALWDEKRGVFTSRYVRGASIERVTLSTLMPLLAPGLRPTQRQGLLQCLHDPACFRGSSGAPAWVPWEGDAEAPPVQALHQILLLEALRHAGAEEERQHLARTLATTLVNAYREFGRLPDPLVGPPPAAGARPSDTDSAALAILLAAPLPSAAPAVEPTSPVLRWMDRHRSVLLSGVIGLLAVSVVAVAVLFLAKTTPPRASLEAWTGLAIRYHHEGRYDEAQELYEKLLASGRDLPIVELLLANTLLKKGELEEAETRYRRLVAKRDPHPVAWLNLAVTLYLRGQTNEAFQFFQEFADKYDQRQPQLAFRARTAMALLAPEPDPAATTPDFSQ